MRENEWFAAYDLLNSLTGDAGTSPAAYRDSLHAAAAQGIVGLVDFEFSAGAAEWVERWHAGCDLIRVRVATYADGLEDVIAAGLRSGDRLVDGDDRLMMGPLKIISDGSLNTRTAWCCEPYADGDRLEHPSGAANLAHHELAACSPAPTSRDRDRHPRDRRRRGRPRPSTPTRRPAPAARSSTPS